MFPLGSEKRPVIIRVQSQEKATKIIQICEQYGFQHITGIEPYEKEDYSDLVKAIKERNTPADIYAPCPCGSGLKFKFCCAKKPMDLAL